MIEFVPGPHGEVISGNQRLVIEMALKDCMMKTATSHLVNVAYNNTHHFMMNTFDYDIKGFLIELKNAVDSMYNKVVVMGGVHSDPFGHTTGLFGQYNEYNEFCPAIVKDSYIRFRFVFDKKHVKAYKVLDEIKVFHFLVDVPQIVQLQLNYRVPVYIYPFYDFYGNLISSKELYPKSRYKKILWATG